MWTSMQPAAPRPGPAGAEDRTSDSFLTFPQGQGQPAEHRGEDVMEECIYNRGEPDHPHQLRLGNKQVLRFA